MSTKGNIYICLGECDDGSIVLGHSSPSGVQINGTTTKDGRRNSFAIELAKIYMKNYYAGWYKRHPKCWRDETYLLNYNQMEWNVNNEEGSILTDPDNIKEMKIEKILRLLFNE